MKQTLAFIVSLLIVPVPYACKYDYAPKPDGYYRIELPDRHFVTVDDGGVFCFDRADNAVLHRQEATADKELFSLWYDDFGTTITGSYVRMTKADLPRLAAATDRLLEIHARRADGISRHEYANPDYQVYGTLYRLYGKVPAPFLFVLTDSVNRYLTGELLLPADADHEQLAVVIERMEEDIHVLMESFRWKK